MARIMTLQQAEAVLAQYVPMVAQITGKDITLERMRPLMHALGNPQDKLRIIHVAGTSGKTSTCYYISRLLQNSGKTVALSVSPHIDSVTERLQVNGQPVDEQTFCSALEEFLALIKHVEPQPTYFELLVAFAYWYFAKTKVDYAVIETGMGGLHDATNIAQNANKLCVITDIGLDHMSVLGNTIPEIAMQKAGIIHAGNQVLMYDQGSDITDVFQQKAASAGAQLQLLQQEALARRYADEGFTTLPLFQQRNWLLARHVAAVVAVRDELVLGTGDSFAAVPGRMNKLEVEGKRVIIDGAHNQQKMEALVQSLTAQQRGPQATIVLALKDSKDYKKVLPLLQGLCSDLIITTFDSMQDVPIRSANPTQVATQAENLGFASVLTIKNHQKAIQTALQTSSKTVIITGSLYLAALARKMLAAYTTGV